MNLPPLRKKLSRYWTDSIRNKMPTVLLSMLIGTYLDLFFVGKGIYTFPVRPLPTIFSINIFFPLIGLPIFTVGFLHLCQKVKRWNKPVLIFLLSLIMATFEKFAEKIGYFSHIETWKHSYSFFGYLIFLLIILLYDRFNRQLRN